VLSVTEPMIGILKSRGFIKTVLENDELKVALIETLTQLPPTVCNKILTLRIDEHGASLHDVLRKSNSNEVRRAIQIFDENMSRYDYQSSERYKIPIPSAPPFPVNDPIESRHHEKHVFEGDKQEVAAYPVYPQDEENTVMIANNVQLQREPIPEYLSKVIDQEIENFRHPNFLGIWNIFHNINLIYSWLFLRERQSKKADFLDKIKDAIYKNEGESYTDCIFSVTSECHERWMTQGVVGQIIFKLRLLDNPVVRVQPEMNNSQGKVDAMVLQAYPILGARSAI
jgi:hypothetical protein